MISRYRLSFRSSSVFHTNADRFLPPARPERALRGSLLVAVGIGFASAAFWIVDAIAKAGPFHAAWVRDPDGNYLGLHDSLG